MKRFLLIFIFLFLLTGCAGQGIVVPGEQKKELVKMGIFWGLPIGIPEAMSPKLVSALRENGIEASINVDVNNKNINFNSVANDQLIILSDLVSAIILKDNQDWRIVGRLSDFRIGLLVPKNSKINSFEDLKGKVIGGNVATAKFVKIRSEKYGLDPESSFNFVPMDDEAIRSLVLGSNGKSWDKCDAIIVPDGLLAYFEIKNLVKLIDQDLIVLPIIARNDFIQENPEVIVNFFKAFSSTLESFRKDMISEKKFAIEGMPDDIAPEINGITYRNEDNFDEQGLKPLRFYFNKEEINSMQETVDMVFDYPIAKPRININGFMDLSYMEKAMERKIKE